MKKILIIILLVILITICAILIFNTKVEVEYVPESEIEESDLRKTVVELYYKDINTGEIQRESRLIDSKKLLLDPYTELLELLMNGSDNDNLESLIPNNAKLNSVKLEKDCVNIDFSNEFCENTENLDSIIEAIKLTLTQLTEVNSVKITVDGAEI